MSATIRSSVGAVAIGKNEGERLKVCLQSLARQVSHVVYVDSGSSDGSVEFARSVEFLARSLQLAPSASVLTLLGMALQASGEEERARDVLDEASTLRRRSEGVEFVMMECLRDSTRSYSRVHDRNKT